MDQEVLVGPYIEYGRQALAALEAASIHIRVGLMAFLPEYDDWRLILSSPDLDQTNSLRASDKVFQVWNGRFVGRLPPVLILPTKDPLVREVRSIFSGENAIQGGELVRLSGQILGGRFMHDAFVYQAEPARIQAARKLGASRGRPVARHKTSVHGEAAVPQRGSHA